MLNEKNTKTVCISLLIGFIALVGGISVANTLMTVSGDRADEQANVQLVECAKSTDYSATECRVLIYGSH